MRVEKTKNSLPLAIDGEQRMDEKTGRNPITGRTEPAAFGLAACEIDFGGVLRDHNPPPRRRRHGAPRPGFPASPCRSPMGTTENGGLRVRRHASHQACGS